MIMWDQVPTDLQDPLEAENLTYTTIIKSTWSHFVLRSEEEERVTAKFWNRPDLPHVLLIEHTFPQVHSSTIYDLTTRCYPRSQPGVNAPSLPGKFQLHRNSWPFWCKELRVTMPSMHGSQRGPCSISFKLLSFSLANGWSLSNR